MRKWWLPLALLPCACAAPMAETNAPVTQAQPAPEAPAIEAGVSHELAKWRAAILSDVEYDLAFSIPAGMGQPIAAELALRFDLASPGADLPLDFREDPAKISSVSINGTPTPLRFEAEHVLLPAELLREGPNTAEITFTAGDTSLNRNPDFLYTLFVPDRARTAFPVFDQPDLKASYRLTLEVPANWQAQANAPLTEERVEGDRKTLRFAQSKPIASYLFAFAAGEFESVSREVNGRQMTLLHRETDQAKIDRNIDAIFDLHGEALAWMEEYSGIPYPFAKFDFVAIPGFQYGGMEHPGAIQYRARSLFLDEDPSQPQLLNRASLIAHETAHMWFGDDVTMRWFDDVWTKEVFANFMAAKIVNPSFPEVDHELSFLLDHYPSAYGVDRTEGANAIRQPLANLNQAGSLYGAIIYDKAPIMMRQLELVLGEDAFRDGMREYLATFAGGNATWPELIAIFDKRSDEDLAAWSEVWVNTPGRPHFVLAPNNAELLQRDPAGQGRLWAQRFAVSGERMADLLMVTPRAALPVAMPAIINSDGNGYGLFPVDPVQVSARWDSLSDLEKGAALINLREQMLEGHPQVAPAGHYDFLFERALGETNELLLAHMLGQMSSIYWTLLPVDERSARAPAIEATLWKLADNTVLPPSTRKLAFGSLQGFAATPETLARLHAIWSGEEVLQDVNFSERELTGLAASLALRMPEQTEDLLETQAGRISNPDDQRRFAFLRPALSADPAAREAFFASLAKEENRAIENWVLSALGYLHHPLRTDHSKRFVQQSLELLEEIQRTGDIFFPAGWVSATLGNHTDPAVAQTVRQFLAERPDYNPQLRMKILQAADPVFRAAELRGE